MAYGLIQGALANIGVNSVFLLFQFLAMACGMIRGALANIYCRTCFSMGDLGVQVSVRLFVRANIWGLWG